MFAQVDSRARLFSCSYPGSADMVFNVLWLTSVICWTGRVAARCTGFPNYCSLRRVQQIYGQWEESSIPTITPSARIKLTICNLNRLNTRASREKHNQPGRGPEEINSKTLFVFLLSPGPPIFFTFSYRSNPIFSNSLALAYTHGFVSHQWPPLRLSLQHTDILLGRDFHYLRSGTIYQGMSSSHPVWLTEGSSFYWILRSTVFFFPTAPSSNETDDKSEQMFTQWSMSCFMYPWLHLSTAVTKVTVVFLSLI